ncbi:CLUMA_CG007097, isoform A [Clunio marinus]|uniref:CLUMA_CG007097, isoform A n=1 Tax=Clunio marinus TaxID=568069 RepID=A0A1J1I1U9_9DIPT|nr:CLUMA_CG007097, isoform A [Clunio marinus]
MKLSLRIGQLNLFDWGHHCVIVFQEKIFSELSLLGIGKELKRLMVFSSHQLINLQQNSSLL